MALLTAITLAGLLIAVASPISGPTFVTHERPPCQHSLIVSVAVSPSLCRLTADRRLQFTTDHRHVHRPRPHRSPFSVVVALLLLLGGVEVNPGPATATNKSAPRCRSVCSTSAQPVRKPRWFTTSSTTTGWTASPWQRLGFRLMRLQPSSWTPLAPPGYEVVHRHRGLSTDKRGGGVAFIHCQTIKATTVEVGDYTEFESLAVKFVCRTAASISHWSSSVSTGRLEPSRRRSLTSCPCSTLSSSVCWTSTPNRSPSLWSTWQPLSIRWSPSSEAAPSLTGTSVSPVWPTVRQTGLPFSMHSCARQHHEVPGWPRQGRTRCSVCHKMSLHSDCYTASTKLSMVTPSLPSWSQLSANSLSTKSGNRETPSNRNVEYRVLTGLGKAE